MHKHCGMLPTSSRYISVLPVLRSTGFIERTIIVGMGLQKDLCMESKITLLGSPACRSESLAVRLGDSHEYNLPRGQVVSHCVSTFVYL